MLGSRVAAQAVREFVARAKTQSRGKAVVFVDQRYPLTVFDQRLREIDHHLVTQCRISKHGHHAGRRLSQQPSQTARLIVHGHCCRLTHVVACFALVRPAQRFRARTRP